MTLCNQTRDTLPSLTVFVEVPGRKRESSEQSLLPDKFLTFGNQRFLRYQAQVLKQTAAVKAYKRQENEFCKHLRYIRVANTSADAIVI